MTIVCPDCGVMKKTIGSICKHIIDEHGALSRDVLMMISEGKLEHIEDDE